MIIAQLNLDYRNSAYYRNSVRIKNQFDNDIRLLNTAFGEIVLCRVCAADQNISLIETQQQAEYIHFYPYESRMV
jgi:hypothetical protein